MARSRARLVPIILAMFVGVLLPLQGRAARVVEPPTAAPPAAACDHGSPNTTFVDRQRHTVRRDALDDVDAMQLPCAWALGEPSIVVVVVLAARIATRRVAIHPSAA